jgi:hypothetical protein
MPKMIPTEHSSVYAESVGIGLPQDAAVFRAKRRKHHGFE